MLFRTPKWFSQLIHTMSVAVPLALCVASGPTAIAQNRFTKPSVSKAVVDANTSPSSLTGGRIPNVTATFTAAPISLNISTGVLYIDGDSGANNASAEIDARGTATPGDDQVVAKVTWGNTAYLLSFPQSSVREIYFQGYEGNDRFLNATDILSRADGGAGDDSLSGGQGDDFLYGGPGNDFIYGGLGNDRIFGGPDNDNILGCEGSDTLFGEDGDDTITDYAFHALDSNILDGGNGNDLMYGSGDLSLEEISGGAGDDVIRACGVATVYGNDGNDVIYGTPHMDMIYGQAGNDKVYAGDGDDRVKGGDGADWLFGEGGNDAVIGDSGDDWVDGGNGNDFVYGGEDDDAVHGGAGDDAVVGGDGSDIMYGEDGKDFRSGGYAAYDISTGEGHVYGDNHTDWNYDELWGGTGSDQMVIADQKFIYLWLDEEYDAEDEDHVVELGFGSGFIANVKWDANSGW